MSFVSQVEAEEHAQLDTVRIAQDGVAEMDRHRRIIFVPREDVLRLELAYGSGAEHPLILAMLGIVCAVLAIASLVTFALAVTRGGVRIPASLITGVVFLVPAWWLLDLALRKRWFLRVHTRNGTRKLIFHEIRSNGELERFLMTARHRFGYS